MQKLLCSIKMLHNLTCLPRPQLLPAVISRVPADDVLDIVGCSNVLSLNSINNYLLYLKYDQTMHNFITKLLLIKILDCGNKLNNEQLKLNMLLIG